MTTLRPFYDLVQLGLDDYEDNELVLEIVHDLTQFFEQHNCTCHHSKKQKDLRTCHEKVGFKRFFERYIEYKSLEKKELELVIKTQLMTLEITNEKSDNSTTTNLQRYKYCYNTTLPLCRPVFLKMCGINDYLLRTLMDHLHAKGLSERIHGNVGRIPKTDNRAFVNSDITFSLKQFLVQYSCIHSLPSPLRHRNDSNTFIYLPTDRTYTSFQQPASDLCETCEEFKAKLKVAKSDMKSKDDFTIAHVCYDWVQNVFIPYLPQQVSSIYFKSAFSVHLFEVCKTEGGQNHQLNFVIGEGELPKGTSKGANTTINMLVMLGWYEDITINFMIPGHIKFICDSFFGHIKKAYWKHRVNIIDDIKNIINNSSEGNEAILYNNGTNWNWYDFSEFFKKHFVPLPNIKQYYHFRFSFNNIGMVYVSKESGGEESCFKLLNSDNFDKNGKPDLIDITLLTKERQNYLYSKIRQYVDDPL
ncbi:hypothetical protein GLOIN_2v1884495 [Rhizophagus clarus]|uniref:DUF7869 domain-containing protein n=1 Tax=Rhizophagus clarus TaxID=94130 RepID=A0A8H3LHU2_9GLOM|nr:hypothetical protein GLOIN_2v1884495 [Rhizophagus clarus]